MVEKEFYDENYFENGLGSKKSCYENYRWIPELTIPMANKLVNYLAINNNYKLLDFGCSKGYLVKALRLLDYDCYGVDISEYAISKIDPDIKTYCKLINDSNLNPFEFEFDYLFSKDVLEHMRLNQLENLLTSFSKNCKNMFHVIPLGDDGNFRINEYHLDKSHVQIQNEEWWIDLFEKKGWKLEDFKYQIIGIKDKWTKFDEKGNGFFKLSKK